MKPPLLTAAIITLSPLFAPEIASSQVLYGVGAGGSDGSSNLYVINNVATSPVAVDIGEIGFEVLDIAIDPVL